MSEVYTPTTETGREPPPDPRDQISMRARIEAIKENTRIETVAADYGGEFRMVGNERLIGRCLSPEHADRTPSMSIFIGDQRFKCFGCGERGDVLDLVMLAEGCELHYALVSLSVRYGIELPGRPDSWYAKQKRQQPVRDAVDEMRIRRLQNILYKMVAPFVTDLDDAERAWKECLPVATAWYERMRNA